MSIQKENGYTPIANELLEAIVHLPLGGYELRILLTILRKTYGFSKKEDRIALSQIAKLTKISKPHASRTVTNLGNYNIVTKLGNKLGINKDYQAWRVTKLGNSKKALNLLPKMVRRVTKLGNEKLPKSAPHKQKTNNTKERDVREFVTTMLNHWNSTYKTSYKSVDPLVNNFGHWYRSYSLVEICQAITNIQYDHFWKDKMTPTMLLRKKNPRGEDVDYIGTFLNIKPPEKPNEEYMTPEQAKEKGLLW